MKASFLLLLLVVAAGAQDGTDANETAPPGLDAEPDGPATDGFDLRLAISLAAVAFLVMAFVYVAKR